MKFRQSPGAIFMIRPSSFAFNSQTSSSNTFQQQDSTRGDVNARAREEFDRVVDILLAHEIDVRVFEDDASVVKPDAVFPNNWISLHEDGKVILYPMMAENRRAEVRMDIVDKLNGYFSISEIVDLTSEAKKGNFLEGTGSIVFDHHNSIAYACRSARTDEQLVKYICKTLNYKHVIFDAVDEQGIPVYHTNVVMSVGEKFALICLDAIQKEEDQDAVLGSLSMTGHKVVSISHKQMRMFAGNVLEVTSRDGDAVILLSETAFKSLIPGQVNALTQSAELLPLKIDTIEHYGGGSVRCMITGIHLPIRK